MNNLLLATILLIIGGAWTQFLVGDKHGHIVVDVESGTQPGVIRTCLTKNQSAEIDSFETPTDDKCAAECKTYQTETGWTTDCTNLKTFDLTDHSVVNFAINASVRPGCVGCGVIYYYTNGAVVNIADVIRRGAVMDFNAQFYFVEDGDRAGTADFRVRWFPAN